MKGGRPCRGTKEKTLAGWWVEVPTHHGSTQRMRRSFRDEAAADDWRAAALGAIELGIAVPEPGSPVIARLLADVLAQTPAPEAMTCDDVFAAYVNENYVGLRIADVERRNAVIAMYNNHVRALLNSNGFVTGEDVTRQAYVDWLIDLAAEQVLQQAQGVGSENLTTKEAVAITGKSRSAIKNRIRNGEFPNTFLTVSGRRFIPYADLAAAGLTRGPLRTGPRTPQGYSIQVIRDIRKILDSVLFHGQQIAGWTLSFDPKLVNNPHRRSKKRKRFQVTISDAAGMSEHLHAVHATALWLLRVMALRVSEAYGVNVGDVFDDGERMLIKVYRQGGKDFDVLDEHRNEVRVTSKEVLKTAGSERALMVPRQLAALIRIVIEIFHTDPVSGAIDPNARLIPGLMRENQAGQSAFRPALAVAAAAASVDVGDDPERALLPVPRDMRAGALTDLRWEDVSVAVRKRHGGHCVGDDVQSRFYFRDDPTVAKLLPATEALEKLIDEQCPDGLIFASTTRCTTGDQRALAPDADRIDAALIAVGWLKLPTGERDEELCDTAEAASLLQRGQSTIRKWMRSHPDVVVSNSRRHLPLDVVLAECARIRGLRILGDVAAEWGCLYHQLYYWVGHFGLATEVLDHNVHIPPETESRLKELLDAERALHARAMSIAHTADDLRVTTAVIHRLIAGGYLTTDPQRGPKNAVFITRASINEFRATHMRRSA